MLKNKRKWLLDFLIVLAIGMALNIMGTVRAKESDESQELHVEMNKTKNQCRVYQTYWRCELPSDVSQFLDKDDIFCFAYDINNEKLEKGSNIKLVRCINGGMKKIFSIKQKHEQFGGVICDKAGYYYIVTADVSDVGRIGVETIFVSKYSEDGKLIKTISSSGEGDYRDEGFQSRWPFYCGNCKMAIKDDILTVFYGREMHNGHQSDTNWMIDLQSFSTIHLYDENDNMMDVYHSHSFAQRVVPFENGFLYCAQGDCYPRAFVWNYLDLQNKNQKEDESFHFWCKENAHMRGDMWDLNETYAHMGDICLLKNGKVAFIASSVKSMNKKALKERQQIFIQIFDPRADLSQAASYTTVGVRAGQTGSDGNEDAIDYGVKWLTNTKQDLVSPQAVVDAKGNIVILYELYNHKTEKFMGVYSVKESRGQPKTGALKQAI